MNTPNEPQRQESAMSKRFVQVVVAPPLGRVVRYKRDQVGNDLTASLMWCELHNEPVWVSSDGSFECPHARVVGWSPEPHPIVAPPWERAQHDGSGVGRE